MRLFERVFRSRPRRAEVHGFVARGFEPVREVFAENFRERGEIGAACAVYRRGEPLVDLWGGERDVITGSPWEEDTMVMVFSTTKGMSAVALAVAHAKGLFRYDDLVASHWPEFAQAGKAHVTVRQLLGHEAGLPAIDVPFDARMLADLDRVAVALAAQSPAWAPGTAHGYHAISLGLYENELLRRVDPLRRSIGGFFRDEVAKVLGVDFHIGLPETVPSHRVARIKGFHLVDTLLHMGELPPRFVLALLDPRTITARAFGNPRIVHTEAFDAPEYRAVELPGTNGIGTARAVAKVYDAMASGGEALGVGHATFEALTAAPGPARRDEVLRIDTRFSLGFLRPSGMSEFGSSGRSFGTPGAGGSFGFADPEAGLGFAYAMNRMGFRVADDPREKALRDATYRCLGR